MPLRNTEVKTKDRATRDGNGYLWKMRIRSEKGSLAVIFDLLIY